MNPGGPSREPSPTPGGEEGKGPNLVPMEKVFLGVPKDDLLAIETMVKGLAPGERIISYVIDMTRLVDMLKKTAFMGTAAALAEGLISGFQNLKPERDFMAAGLICLLLNACRTKLVLLDPKKFHASGEAHGEGKAE